MNLKDFEYFNALGEMLSFTRVAKKFQVSQPSISYAVKQIRDYGIMKIRHWSHIYFRMAMRPKITLIFWRNNTHAP